MNNQNLYELLNQRKCCFCGVDLLAKTARYTSSTAIEKTKFYTCEHCGTYSEYEVDDYMLGTSDIFASLSDADPGL